MVARFEVDPESRIQHAGFRMRGVLSTQLLDALDALLTSGLACDELGEPEGGALGEVAKVLREEVAGLALDLTLEDGFKVGEFESTDVDVGSVCFHVSLGLSVDAIEDISSSDSVNTFLLRSKAVLR